MIKEQNKKLLIFVEIFIVSLVIWIINLRYRTDFGFWTVPVNPYFIVAVLFSSYYGWLYGYASLGFSFLFILMDPFQAGNYFHYWKELMYAHYVYAAVAIAAVYLFGVINRSFTVVIDSQRKFIRRIAKDKNKLQKELAGVTAVNREFEERVLLQNDSVTSLYNQVEALNSQNLTKSLNIFLSTVQKFIQAEKASIWEYQKETKSLVMIANIGWTGDDVLYSVEDVDTTVNGWVYRNNKMFSVRMLFEYELFSRMDTRRNILSYPINISQSTWGVLSIERLPFPRFNLYTEKILAILVDLAGPAIERALEYESMLKHSDVNTFTGLPSPAQFMTVVEKEIKQTLEKNGVFSVILVEITNFDTISENFGEAKAYSLMMVFIEEMKKIAENRIDVFHYKEWNQLALLYPNIDYDGSAFYSFQSLGVISSKKWMIDDKDVDLEVIFGYAAMSGEEITVNELLDAAEQLLEIQKV